jgi:2-succinyl-5-enolpyruvyl-6-hydroxy-3-cyclohexene-1-carboxylate synthase
VTLPSAVVAATLVDELARGGVRHACISPGARSGPLAAALLAHPHVAIHVVLDERSAAFTALGIAKATLLPVAIVTTSGTAAANLHPAVVEAHHARVPLIAVTADRPPELRDTGASQAIEQTRLFSESVRWFADVEPEASSAAAYLRSLGARACIVACGSPPGPVHLNVPLREPLTADPASLRPLAGRADGAAWTSPGRSIRSATEDEIDRLGRDIDGAARGVIVAGPGSGGAASVLAFARAVAWPVLAEPTSGLRTAPPALSTYDALLRYEPFARSHEPDFVVRVGAAPISKALLSWLSPDVPQVLVDPDAGWPDPSRAARRHVAADPGALFARLLARGRSQLSSGWLRSWANGERRARAAIDDVLDAYAQPSEPRTARDLSRDLPDGTTLVAASSMPVRDLDSFMPVRAGVRVVANRGANGIDGFVSTVIGVAVAGGAPVVALAGDLSMLHDRNGLLRARAGDINAVFVVIDNDGGGIFSFLPQADVSEGFEELFATPQRTDFAALATEHGCGYECVDAASELVPTTNSALAAGGVHLVEVRTDRNANVALHHDLWDAVGVALDGDKKAAPCGGRFL